MSNRRHRRAGTDTDPSVIERPDFLDPARREARAGPQLRSGLRRLLAEAHQADPGASE